MDGVGHAAHGRCRVFDSFLGSLVLIDGCRSSTLVDYMDMQVMVLMPPRSKDLPRFKSDYFENQGIYLLLV